MSLFANKVIPRIRPFGRRIQRRIDAWLVDLSERSPLGPFDRAALSALTRARQGLLFNLEGLSGLAEVWQGAEVRSGRVLRVAYVGDQYAYKVNSPRYLQHILFQPDSFSVESLGECAMTGARRLAQRLASSADLVIVDGSDVLRWQPAAGEWLLAPSWVRMIIPFHPGQTWADVEKNLRFHRENIRTARRAGLTALISHSDADFELFFERMHVPMMQDRHKEYGVIDNKEHMRRLFHEGLLFMVYKDGQAVAGEVLHLRRNSLFGISNGYLDGDPRWLNDGAISLLYLETIRWSLENGMARYDMGGVRPFTANGLYQYKLHWGALPEVDLWHGRSWLLWAPSAAPAAVDWLRAHPLAPVQGAVTSAGLAGSV